MAVNFTPEELAQLEANYRTNHRGDNKPVAKVILQTNCDSVIYLLTEMYYAATYKDPVYWGIQYFKFTWDKGSSTHIYSRDQPIFHKCYGAEWRARGKGRRLQNGLPNIVMVPCQGASARSDRCQA